MRKSPHYLFFGWYHWLIYTFLKSHRKRAKSTSTSLWSLVPSFLFCAFHFSSHFLPPPPPPLLLYSHLSSDYSKPVPWGARGGHKEVSYRERKTWKKIDELNEFHTEKEKIVMPVQIFSVLFFSAPSMPIIQSEKHTEPSRLTHTDWIINVCLILLYVQEKYRTDSISQYVHVLLEFYRITCCYTHMQLLLSRRT